MRRWVQDEKECGITQTERGKNGFSHGWVVRKSKSGQENNALKHHKKIIYQQPTLEKMVVFPCVLCEVSQ